MTDTAQPLGLPGKLALTSLIFGGLTQTYGSFLSARSSRDQLRFEADLAEINAERAERAAQQELRRGGQAQRAVRLRGAQVKSSQRARLAANGIDLSSASAVELQTSTDYITEVDAQTIEQNAIRAAWGHRTAGTNARMSAASGRAAASAISAGAEGFSTLLTQAGQVAGTWYSVRKG